MKEIILGVKVDTDNYDELIKKLFKRIDNKEKSLVVAINPEKLMKAKEDQSLKDLLNRAEFQIPDGIGVILASKLNKGNIKSRVTGIDMMDRIVREAAKTGKSIYLYGAKPGVADQAAQALRSKYPSLKIAGIQDGYEQDNEKVIQKINEVKPEILFVAMGSPRQENWIEANRDRLYPSLYQGVGGSFDVLAGNVKRAPKLFLNTGTEWLYRLMIEPTRIKRQLALPLFLVETLKK
ncbi:N-acetylglucosaminyldiphosphoundecaprenol N-acetyl-beta-D-mannosaminyltransferase [Psychrobacillus insolitus]|uniref:N-acetylglucosaminyldiphosphoundecaprenol N-acetyl-beta-D-mannosaminyltransferase n=1 Tax=Psychrobacillus insolitus TaxID=1461 RepID=A0A2W7MRU6_9BACI|nr:WecB/TagA/CpsF family glycosyltransferase [Psychrobacillus insolitus]PZX05922.1 N-acetylglucosaminyldiphosphoundecaprenol N-acetyl-beta-D-mannosaminyltransferase [Psychrobacillus insolitus]